jgi:hypothetical protein
VVVVLVVLEMVKETVILAVLVVVVLTQVLAVQEHLDRATVVAQAEAAVVVKALLVEAVLVLVVLDTIMESGLQLRVQALVAFYLLVGTLLVSRQGLQIVVMGVAPLLAVEAMAATADLD